MTDKIERQCGTCSAYVYPTDRGGSIIWLPTDGEGCSGGLHEVSGFADAANTLAFEQRRDAVSSESATPTEGTPGVKHPDPNLPSSHSKSCPLHDHDATGLEVCSCGTGVLLVPGATRPDLPVFCERCGLVVTAGPRGTWLDEESETSDCPNYSGLHRVRGRTRTWAHDSRTLGDPKKLYVTGTEPAYVDHGQYSYTPAEAQTEPLDMSDTSTKWAYLGESIAEGLAEAAKPWAKLAEEIQAGFRKPSTVIARIVEGLPLDDQAFKVGAFGDSMDEASWHRVDPDHPGQSLCGEPSAQWPYVMRSALPLLGQPTCSVCEDLVGDIRPYLTADGHLLNLPAGVEPFDVKPVLLPTYPKSAPGEGVAVGWSVPTDRIYDPINQEAHMDHDNDQPTTDAETPELLAFQKRDEVARMIRDVINGEIEDELTPEDVSGITLAAAEMLLSNYFMREVER